MTAHRKTQPSITAGGVSLGDGAGYPPIHMALPYRPENEAVFVFQLHDNGYELVAARNISDARRRFGEDKLPFSKPDARDVQDGIIRYRRGASPMRDWWETIPLEGDYIPVDDSVGNEMVRG